MASCTSLQTADIMSLSHLLILLNIRLTYFVLVVILSNSGDVNV